MLEMNYRKIVMIVGLNEKTHTIDRLNIGLNELKYKESGKE